jgi:murein L,D-transpeptidase YcbB/YkuD
MSLAACPDPHLPRPGFAALRIQESAKALLRARVARWTLALMLLAMLGSAAADLRTTLSPFVGPFAPRAEPDVDPPAIGAGEHEQALYSPRLLAEFYAERGFAPAWDSGRAQAMLALARESRADGFLPADFRADAIQAVIESDELRSSDPARRDAAELLLSDALLRYVHHFRFGKLNPEHVNRGSTFVKPADAALLKADMAKAVAASDMQAELRARMPHPDFYQNLKKGYQRYLAIADRGGWKDIPGGRNLMVGANDSRVPLIREHLEVTAGYAPGTVAEPERYDEDLAEAIKGFQRRSGLGADGVVGPNTLRALNQPLDKRLLAIRANLERMRWLYNDLPPDYLFVDLAAFELYLIRNNEEVWRTKGIIGTVENQTPMFRDEMEHVVFNPTWTVPRSIEKKFKGVPAGYSRVRSGGQYYLVQQPGPRNALGRVKFLFPNGHAIYLHDTPSRYLFSRARRAYSHGCIRVYQPLTLAQYVLNEPAWSQAEINRVVRRGSTRWVSLDERLPVLLYYLTAKADDQGRVGFRRDIYNRDRRLLAALDEPVDGAERIAFAQPEPEPEPAAAPGQGPAVAGTAAAAGAGSDSDDAASATGETAVTEAGVRDAPADMEAAVPPASVGGAAADAATQETTGGIAAAVSDDPTAGSAVDAGGPAAKTPRPAAVADAPDLAQGHGAAEGAADAGVVPRHPASLDVETAVDQAPMGDEAPAGTAAVDDQGRAAGASATVSPGETTLDAPTVDAADEAASNPTFEQPTGTGRSPAAAPPQGSLPESDTVDIGVDTDDATVSGGAVLRLDAEGHVLGLSDPVEQVPGRHRAHLDLSMPPPPMRSWVMAGRASHAGHGAADGVPARMVAGAHQRRTVSEPPVWMLQGD